MLVKNKKFKSLFNKINFEEKVKEIKVTNNENFCKYSYNEDLCELPYIGMGNPDSTILFVGSEKAFDKSKSDIIDLHERKLNYLHWYSIINNYGNINDHLHPELKLRTKLKGFNPFSPITLDETRSAVYSGPHTYKKIEKIINSQITSYKPHASKTRFDEISSKSFAKSSFNYCFLTDISDFPKKRQKDGDKFKYEEFKKSCRYKHMNDSNSLGGFYRGFKNILIYAGREYTGAHGSAQRNDIIRIFNPKINPLTDYQKGEISEIYQTQNGGAKIIFTHQLTSRIFNTDYSIEHKLACIDMVDCIN
jgi:hypothetical protein